MNQSATLDPQMQSAVELHRLLRYQEAEQAYRSIIARQPGNADAHHLLGVLLHQAGHPERAIELIERAIAILPESAQFHASLGRAHHALSHYAQAIPALRRAADLDPGNAQAWSDVGAALQADDVVLRRPPEVVLERLAVVQPDDHARGVERRPRTHIGWARHCSPTTRTTRPSPCTGVR